MPTPTEIFAEIDSRLQTNSAKTAGLNAVYAFDLSGDNGGPHHIAIHDGTGRAGAGPAENPGCTIAMSGTDFVDLATGKLDATSAFMSGRLKIKGDMGLAMKLQNILRD